MTDDQIFGDAVMIKSVLAKLLWSRNMGTTHK